MKILYLCPDLGIPVLGPKGAAVHVRQMAEALARAGHKVTVAAQVLNKSPWEKPAELKVPVLQVRPSANATAAVQALKEFQELLGSETSLPGELRRLLYNKEFHEDLKRRFENDPPDFIYERASLYATAGVMLARDFGAPLLLELNAPLAVEQEAYRATGFGTLAAEAEKWTVRNADAVLPVSTELRRHALDLGAEAGRLHVIPNGVNTELFGPARRGAGTKARLNLNGGPVLGFVGGLRPWHGVEALPELLARIRKRQANARLVIAGEGPLKKELEKRFEARGVSRNVIFTGTMPHEEVASVIRCFDIALAPYPRAGHGFYFSPLKLFEYMACGVPVVAANLGQIAEVIADGETGMLYPAGDVEAMAEKCEILLAKPALRAALGKAAARVVREGFTWDKNAERVTQIAAALVRAGRQGGA